MGEIASSDASVLLWDQVSTFKIATTGAPMANKNVIKVGRTTGLTTGKVALPSVDFNVDINSLPPFVVDVAFPILAFPPLSGDIPFTRILKDQVVAEMINDEGDSGAPILSEDGTSLEGILWGHFSALVASYTLYSPIKSVLDELGPLQFAYSPPITTADLVLDHDPSAPGFCKLDGQFHELHISVKNEGVLDAPASTTHIDFTLSKMRPFVDVPTPSIAAGKSFDIVPFPPPSDCYVGIAGCLFKITVDLSKT